MLALRAIIIILGGLVFMFLPGVLVSLASQRGLRYNRAMLLWGMALLVLTLPANYLTVVLGYILVGDGRSGLIKDIAVAMLGSLIAALFIHTAQYLILRGRRKQPGELLGNGVMIGLGFGLLNKVFLGFILTGIGMRLLFGDTVTADLGQISIQTWPSMLISLVALITDRLALVVVYGALGVFVARSIIEKNMRWFWGAVAANTAFATVYASISLGLDMNALPANLLIIAYEGILVVGVLRWLMGQSPTEHIIPASAAAL
jgi:hypothetical protein